MANILVVYGTTWGHTALVADRIARNLSERGHRVMTWAGDDLPADESLDEFDGFLLAGSVIRGHHQKYLADFARRHRDRLNAAPSAFVSVCGALGNPTPETEREAQGYVDAFLAGTGWHPAVTRSFAGALAYTRYPLLLRWIMKRISRRTGNPTDTSRDWNMTDWPSVDRFATELSGLVGQPAVMR